MSTPNTNSQTNWQRAISRVMNGIIFCGLFNNSHFSLICSSQNLSCFGCPETETVARREKEKRGLWQSQSRRLKLVSHAATSSSAVQSPIASKSLGTLRAPCHPDWKSTRKLVAREHNQVAASSSQVWQKRCRDGQEYEELVASGISDIDGNGTVWPHNLHVSTANVSHLEKVLSNVRQRYGRKPEEKMEDLDVNTILWRMFMSVTLQAAVHLWNGHAEHLHSIKNQPKRIIETVVQFTWEVDQGSQRNLSSPGIYSQQLVWQRSTLLTDRAVQFATAKNLPRLRFSIVYGRTQFKSRQSMEGEDWKVCEFTSIQRIGPNRRGADEVRVENFPWIHSIADPRWDSNMMSEIKCEPKHFQGLIIFMSMYNDIVSREKGNREIGVANSLIGAAYARKIAQGHSSFLGPGSEKKWCGTHTCKPNGDWDRVADIMMINFSESGHPVFFVGPVLLKEEICWEKAKEKHLYISVVTTKQPKWFFAQSFPSISSLSTKHWRICVKSWPGNIPNVRRVRWNP